MKEYLVIRLAGEHQPVEWLLADGDGTRRSGVSTGSLEQAAAASGDRDVIALVPSEELLSTTAEIPVRSHAKIRAALPQTLHDKLGVRAVIEHEHVIINQNRQCAGNLRQTMILCK